MGENSKIAWTHHTFNPWVGCQRISPGCTNCYAEAYDRRVGGLPKAQRKDPEVQELRWGPTAPRVRTSAAYWRKPIEWNRAAAKAGVRHRVFCASLADVFERLQPGQVGDLDSWRLELFELIASTPHLDWLLLTKRPELIKRGISGAVDAFERTAGCVEGLDLAETWLNGLPPSNVWLGTTVEDQQRADERIPELLAVPAAVRFLSCEPLLEPVELGRSVGFPRVPGPSLDWVIIGGESGPNARPFHLDWARDLVEQSLALGACPFVKQLGAVPISSSDEDLCGRVGALHACHADRRSDFVVELRDPAGANHDEWPEDLRVREFPVQRCTGHV